MMPSYALPQTDINYVRGTDAYVHGVRGHEVVWVASDHGLLLEGEVIKDSDADLSSGLGNMVGMASAVSNSVSFPDREWTPLTKKRLESLVVKAALHTITPEERREMRDLQGIRRENISGLTFEDVMRSAELDRRLANLKKALEEYVNYLPC
jgi:hypothetical protein